MIDLDTLKTVLRGLVVSNPGVMTLETLCRDYRTSEGHELPFRQLGFRSAGDLLTSFGDTVRIRGNIVSVVSSEETAHLESLIARQRKGRKRGRPSSGFYRKPSSSKQYVPLRSQNTYHSSSRGSAHSAYPSTSGQSHSRSFNSVTHYSNRREDNRYFQKEEVRSRSPEENRRPAKCYDDESDNDSEDEYDEFEVVDASNGEHLEDCSYEVEKSAYSPVKDSLYEKEHDDLGTNAVGLASSALDVNSSISCNGRRSTVKDYLDSEDDDSISPRMQRNLKEIIMAYPSGLRCARLPEEYLRRFGVPLDCRQCGYVSVNQMAMALPEVFRCVRINSGDWMLFDASQPPPEQFLHTSNDDEFAPEVSGRVLERISSILSTKCSGVNLNDFAVNYTLLYGTLLTDDVKDFESMEDLFRSLNQSKVLIVREVNGEMIVFPPSGKGNHLNNDALPVELTWEEIRSTLPPTACKPEEKCHQFTFPKSVEFGHYIVVGLAEIYTPWKFWIHLYGREYSQSLNDLMDYMQIFYNQNNREYFAPVSQWRRGQHCVALYDHEWHRAEILRIVDKDRVKLKYFDYGTIDVVKKTDLRLLDQQFLNLPMMAFKAKLSAIKPAKGQKVWSREANEFFFSLVNKKRLVASVAKILRDPPFLSVALVNTEEGEDVHINDLLVESGFAEFSTDSDSEWTDEPVESDYVEVKEDIEKWESEVNKANPITLKTEDREDVHESLPLASTVKKYTKSFAPSVNVPPHHSASNSDIIVACFHDLESFRPPSLREVTSAGETIPFPASTSAPQTPMAARPTSPSDPPTPASDPPTPASDPPTPASDPPTPASDPPTPASDPPTSAADPPTPASAPPGLLSTSPIPTSAPPGLLPTPPRTVPSAHPLPNSNYPLRPHRPPPGFRAIAPMRVPPGLGFQGPNLYYVNNNLPPTVGPSNVTPQVPPNVMYSNMVNSMGYNRMPYNQVPMNTGVQYPQFNGHNPMVARQMLMTSYRQNLPPMQQWPVNAPFQWNSPYNNCNQLMVQPPAANNNPMFQPQYSLQQNQSGPNQSYPNQFYLTPSYQVQPANTVPLNNNNYYVPNKTEERIAAPSNARMRSASRTKYVPEWDTEASAAESISSLAEKITLKTPSPPLPPPELAQTPSPVDEPVGEIKEAESDPRSSAEVAPKSPGEETLFCENPGEDEDDCEEDGNDCEEDGNDCEKDGDDCEEDGNDCEKDGDDCEEDGDYCEEEESLFTTVPSGSSSPDPKTGSHPVSEEGIEVLESAPGTPVNEMESTEEESDPVTPPRRLWKSLDVGVGVVHLLNLDGEAHVSSDELARVCLKMKGHKDLAKILASKSVTETFFEYTRRENSEFFSSLDLCPELKEIMLLDGKTPQRTLLLIPLKKVVGALIAAGIKVPKVVFAFQNARRDVKAKDDYWQEESEDFTVTSEFKN